MAILGGQLRHFRITDVRRIRHDQVVALAAERLIDVALVKFEAPCHAVTRGIALRNFESVRRKIHGIDPRARGETLAPADFARLANVQPA